MPGKAAVVGPVLYCCGHSLDCWWVLTAAGSRTLALPHPPVSRPIPMSQSKARKLMRADALKSALSWGEGTQLVAELRALGKDEGMNDIEVRRLWLPVPSAPICLRVLPAGS